MALKYERLFIGLRRIRSQWWYGYVAGYDLHTDGMILEAQLIVQISYRRKDII